VHQITAPQIAGAKGIFVLSDLAKNAVETISTSAINEKAPRKSRRVTNRLGKKNKANRISSFESPAPIFNLIAVGVTATHISAL